MFAIKKRDDSLHWARSESHFGRTSRQREVLLVAALFFAITASILGTTEARGFPLDLPSAGEAGPYAVPDSVIRAVGQAKAEQVWGPVTLGPVIPCYDRLGRTIAYYVCFRRGTEPFPSFDSILERMQQGRELREEGLRELERHGHAPTPIAVDDYRSGTIATQGKSIKYDRGRRQTWGIDEYVTVLVSASYSMRPIPEYFDGLPRFFTLGDVISQVANDEAGTDARLLGIYFGGRLEQAFAFRSGGKEIYVDPFPCRVISVDEFRLKIPMPPEDCEPDEEVIASRRRLWQELESGVLSPLSTHRIDHWDWVPILLWTGGCSPTSASMVLGLWDNKQNTSFYAGFGRLVDYYYNEYKYPETQSGPVRTNCPNTLAELRSAMATSPQGNTSAYQIDDGMRSVTNSINDYSFSISENFDCPWPWEPCWDWCWSIIIDQIDANRTFAWSVWADTGSGEVGHTLAAWGYQDDQHVGVYTTWDEQEHWWCHDKYGNNCNYSVTHTLVNKVIPGGGDGSNDLYLGAPMGGEVWNACEYHLIEWYQTGTEITQVNIRESNDGGTSWDTVIFHFSSSGEGWHSKNWCPENPDASSECRILVEGLDSAGNVVASAGSYGNFEVSEVGEGPPSLASPPDYADCQPTTAELCWEPVNWAQYYQIQVGTSCGQGMIYQSSSECYQIPAGHLTPGETYEWHVRSYNNCGYSNWSDCWRFTVAPVPLEAPSLTDPPNGSECHPTNITLHWEPVSGAQRYEIVHGTSPGSGDTNYTTNTYLPITVSPGTVYYWRVRAEDVCEAWGDWSNCWSFTTAPTIGVTSLSSPGHGTTCHPTTINFCWNGLSNAILYELQVGASCGSGNIYQTTNTCREVYGLLEGQDYYWRVRGMNVCDLWGDWTACRHLATAPPVPGAPSLSSPPDNSTVPPTPVAFSWQPVSGAVLYRLQVGTSCGSGATYETSNTAYEVTLGEGTYEWRVQAKNECEEWGIYSDCWMVTVSPEACGPPAHVTPLDGTTCAGVPVELCWEELDCAIEYAVQIGTVCESGPIHQTTATCMQIEALESGVTYYWRVRAKDDGGEWDDWGACWMLTTLPELPAQPVLAAPPCGGWVDTLATTVLLDWEDVPGTVQYHLQYGLDEYCAQGTVVFPDTSEYLLDLTGYESEDIIGWKVRAEDGCEQGGAWSECCTFSIGELGDKFVRGDTDANGELNISDPILNLCYQFSTCDPPPCLDAADCDDSGEINISDPIYSLNYQFGTGSPPPPPFSDCGFDPTDDDPLACGSFPPCGTGDGGGALVQIRSHTSTPMEGLQNATISLLAQETSDPGVMILGVAVYSEVPFIGLEFDVEYADPDMHFLALSVAGLTGEAFDFFSGIEKESGRIHIGGLLDIALREVLGAGTHKLVQLKFEVRDDSPMSMRVGSGFIVGDDLTQHPLVSGSEHRWDSPDLIQMAQINSTTTQLHVSSPFSAGSSIELALAEAAHVMIDVYDIHGRKIRRIARGPLTPGMHQWTWSGDSDHGTPAATGVFYVKATVGGKDYGRRILFIR